MDGRDGNALLTEASAAEAAELLAKLDRGYRSAYAGERPDRSGRFGQRGEGRAPAR